MRKLQSQGVHHITIVGADRQTSIDFWEGVLGMPFVFEQPNLDNEAESHLYFDPGDGRLITVFTNEARDARPEPDSEGARLRAPPRVLAVAGDVQAGGGAARRAGIRHSGVKDRGFMDSIYFEDPLGHAHRARVLPLRAAVRPYTHAEVLLEAHRIRVERGDHHIAQEHLADAIEAIVRRSRDSLSDDRSPRQPYRHRGGAHGHEHAEHPQAERQQPHGPDLRAGRGARLRGGGRLGEEVDPEFLAKDPAT